MDIVLRFGVAGGAWEGRGWRVGVVVNVDILKSGWGLGMSFCFMVELGFWWWMSQ